MTTVNYENNFRDFLHFNIHHALRTPTLFLFLAICGFGGWFIVHDLSNDSLMKIILFIIVFVGLMVQGLVLLVLTVLINFSRRKNRAYLAPQTLTIGPDGITEQNEYEKLEIKWSAVPKITATRRFVLIYRQQNSAVLVPTRAFSTRPEADAFYSEVLKYWHDVNQR